MSFRVHQPPLAALQAVQLRGWAKPNLAPALEAPLRTALENTADIEVAIVYGSAARDRLRADSDVDIAVAGTAPFPPERLVDIAHELSRAIHREVDIIDLRATKGLVFYEAMTKGIVLLVRNKTLMAELMKETVYYAADFLPAVQSLLENAPVSIMPSVLVTQKIESLQRCLKRIEDKRPVSVEALAADIDAQDIISINLERAVQQCVDIAVQIRRKVAWYTARKIVAEHLMDFRAYIERSAASCPERKPASRFHRHIRCDKPSILQLRKHRDHTTSRQSRLHFDCGHNAMLMRRDLSY